MNTRFLLKISTSVSCLICLIASSIAYGQSIEEVVVTAKRRVESLQDVTISITAMSGAFIKEQNWTRADDIGDMVPGLMVKSAFSGSGGAYIIRGVGNDVFFPNAPNSVGIYADNVYLNSKSVNLFSLLDIERIEVLKGPQNTLYGRNSTGGVVNYISRKPSQENGTNFQGSLSIGRFNSIDVEAAAGFILGGRTSGRIAVSTNQRDDLFFNSNLSGGRSDLDRSAIRGLLLFEASPDVDILLNYHIGWNRADDLQPKAIGVYDPSLPIFPFAPANCPFGYAVGNGCADVNSFIDSANRRESFSGDPVLLEDINTRGGSLQLGWDAGNFTVTSITAYEYHDRETSGDIDNSPIGTFSSYSDTEAYQVTQELRITSPDDQAFRWIGGFYYFFEDQESWFMGGRPNFNSGFGSLLKQDNEQWALFGEIEFDINDKVSVELGLRYTEESKDGSVLGRQVFLPSDPITGSRLTHFTLNDWLVSPLNDPGTAFLTDTFSQTFDESWEEWGGKLGISYAASDDVMVFAHVSRGFNTGLIETAPRTILALLAPSDIVVDPEVLWAYEIGLKSTLLDGRLRLNASVFWNSFTDQQVFSIAPNTEVVLANAGESTMKGGEIEIQYSPAEGWYTSAGISFLDTNFDEFLFGGVDLSGNKLPNSPEFTFSGLIRKDIQLSSGLFSLQTSFNYSDAMFLQSANNDEYMLEPSRWVVNARVAYQFGPDERYEVSAWGKNLFDEEYCKERNDLTFVGFVACFVNDPVTYGVTAAINFN